MSQKSKEKNVAIEETRRRNEASMARKRAMNPIQANASTASEGPLSPSSTGAMDSLLEKLRAAAPQARDQRDRRRRARLKDRHQIRVASGQKIPDMADLTKSDHSDSERRVISPDSSATGTTTPPLERIVEAASPAATPEGEDVADRAASMLQGLRGDADADPDLAPRDGSLRVRRRRESADDERRSRRRRRGGQGSTADRDGAMPSTKEEGPGDTLEDEPGAKDEGPRVGGDTLYVPPRAVVVSPPSLDGGGRRTLESGE